MCMKLFNDWTQSNFVWEHFWDSFNSSTYFMEPYWYAANYPKEFHDHFISGEGATFAKAYYSVGKSKRGDPRKIQGSYVNVTEIDSLMST